MVRTGTYQFQATFGALFGFRAPSVAALGALAAWIAVILYASSNSIVTALVDIGQMNPVAGGRNAITYTNLYILGSVISLLPLALLYRRDLKRDNLRRLTRRHWSLLTVSAVLSSVLTPGLFFYALEHTTVTNIVLVGRIEPPLFLLATWFFLRERLNPWAMLAGLVALVGAIVIIGADSGMVSFGKGELATVAATLSFIASTIVTRAGLRDVPIGVFAVFRTVIGASLYFILVTAIFGADQFQDLFAPVLWQWVWLYAIVVIVLGQIAWNFGLKHARAGEVSLATSFSPMAAILIAMALLGEDPGPGLIPGGVLIVIAIVIGHLGRDTAKDQTAKSKDRHVVIRPYWEIPGWMPNHVAVRPLTSTAALATPPPGDKARSKGRTDRQTMPSLQRRHFPPLLNGKFQSS
ncbi:DMT family transporter [Roseovarius aestuarii]|uniref:EamA-like transporter family protein n=1 Tax=Roseovarius aestuarii TaxID=475083 RepID=A0A1X7BMC2_9RHOB|nr:DMT family transporter [Roseovarius aestuarii]SMC10776.1 EamA-like transporter family protein [Roseovarius aestuarii]